MVCKFFDKKAWSGANLNEELAQESQNLLVEKFKRRNFYARFQDDAADLVDVELLSSKTWDVNIYSRW